MGFLWKHLVSEYATYGLLTLLFGIRFGTGTEAEGWWRHVADRIALLRLAGVLEKRDGSYRVTERGMYSVSVLMEEFLSALNRFREENISAGI